MGIQLLLAERMERIAQRRKPKDDKVTVDSKKCRGEMVARATAWFFPMVNVEVYNSIGDGLGAPLIVDSGALCCISPHREDFTTYYNSTVKVEDLSGLNKVAGEGMISWKVLDREGREVEIQLRAYHMPAASVRLLSPQSLFNAVKGSDGYQNHKKYTIMLPNKRFLDAPYGRANLPLLALSNSSDLCLWSQCFAFNATDKLDWKKAILDSSDQNLTAPQKEFLVWHFKLSHAGLSTVHNLCRQKRKLKTNSAQEFMNLRDGPMLPCAMGCCVQRVLQQRPTVEHRQLRLRHSKLQFRRK
jgi:hypothetical protein